jgi:uncharacterized protein YbjT (DUF2867 family)
MSQTVAIFGATGAQGAPVVREALEKGMTVRAVARDLAKIAEMHPRAQAFAAGLSDEEAIFKALDGVDAAFLHLPAPQGPDDAQHWLKTFLTAAHRVSLPLLVYTTGATAGPRYPSSMMIDGATGGMQAVLASGIPSIVLQPTIYLENIQPELFVPRLRSEGVLDYPPLPAGFAVQWTSHFDQARIAVAALGRPDLAGNSFEIGSPDAITGPDLAMLLSNWIGRPVRYEPIAPADFGERAGEALGNPGLAFVLTDLYGALGKMDNDQMTIDTKPLEETFGVTLTSVADHIDGWSKE